MTMTIAVSVVISLTLTPMLCSRFLKTHDKPASTAACIRLFERGFIAMLNGYERGLNVVLATSS